MLKDFTKEKFDILIQAGQSNCEGYGFGSIEHPYQPNENVWYLNADMTISQAAEKVQGNEIQTTFGLYFAEEYLRKGLLKEGRKLLILRAAVGGTGFLEGRWNMTGDLYLHMMEMIRTALSLNEDNRLVCLLWHQGETDAAQNASYEDHYAHLSDLISSVRTEFAGKVAPRFALSAAPGSVPDTEAPVLPFLAGDFVHQWRDENPEICAPVLKAIRDVCRNFTNAYFVETDGLLSNRQELSRDPLDWEDHIHFSRKACVELGKRYFDAFLNVRA